MNSDEAYDFLGVNPDCEPEVINAAYRTLAKEYHPDQGGDIYQFQKLKNAYDKAQSKSEQKKSRQRVLATCERCGSEFTTSPAYFKKYGQNTFCKSCYVHSECAHCGTGLRLEHFTYNELNEGPLLCDDCGKKEIGDPWFWEGLGTKGKVGFLIGSVILALNILLLVSGAPADFLAFPALILVVWMYLVGKGNLE